VNYFAASAGAAAAAFLACFLAGFLTCFLAAGAAASALAGAAASTWAAPLAGAASAATAEKETTAKVAAIKADNSLFIVFSRIMGKRHRCVEAYNEVRKDTVDSNRD